MKGSESFNKTINAYLQKRAVEDPLFAEALKKPAKNLDDCVTYILNEVQKSGRNGFDDAEIYNMAVHYYDEDDIKAGSKISHGSVVVNHVVKLTKEEEAAAKQAAFDKVVADKAEKMKKKPQPKAQPEAAKEKPVFVQSSLF